MEEVGDESSCDNTVDIASREERVSYTWAATNISCKDGVIVATDHSKCLFIESLFEGCNSRLGALRALLEVFGSFLLFKVLQVVDAVDERLVAFLEAHDKSSN